MDDLLTGANSIEEARNIIERLSHILKSAGFKLRKWISNETLITQEITAADKMQTDVKIIDSNQWKTLGTYWQTQSDNIRFKVTEPKQTKITKRHILATIARIFDPLGVLGPCIIIAKILLQKLWTCKLSWDESLPAELHEKWLLFCKQIQHINEIQVPRRVIHMTNKNLQLHEFSDASQNAYGACVYIRSQGHENTYDASLLCAKNRVAPLRQQTIPRLELCAALLLARLVAKVVQALKISLEEVTCWTDSTIVLSWLQTHSSTSQVFVSNRIAEIQQLTESFNWQHVPTAENPADLLSRGLAADKLRNSELWWHGPSFLSKNVSEWPQTRGAAETRIAEVSADCCMINQVHSTESSIFAKRLIRITAYCRRFIHNCKNTKQHKTGPITATEAEEALLILLKMAQQESFSEEIKDIASNQRNSTKIKRLVSLNPFIDSGGVLRVGGRLRNSEFDNDKKHPIILSAKHQFSRLIFKDEHLRLLHAPPQLLLSSTRERFWVIGGRNLARQLVHDCVRCFRNKPRQAQNLMGDLPKARVSVSMPFRHRRRLRRSIYY